MITANEDGAEEVEVKVQNLISLKRNSIHINLG